MNCRRCNATRHVNHFVNDACEGWFCPECVDTLVGQKLGELADLLRKVGPRRPRAVCGDCGSDYLTAEVSS